MRFSAFVLSRIAAGITLGLSITHPVAAQSTFESLAASAAQIEYRLDGRVGIALVDTGTDTSWFHRAHERFLMNSIVKTPVCAAILAHSETGQISLSEPLPIHEADLLSYAPVTERHVGEHMTISDLCLAALDMSDNTAANLLIDHLGGPKAVTQFFRSIGDMISRLDRREPDLNTFAPGDPRDTTSPAAMAETLRALLTGDALSPASRDQLVEWMSHGGVTGALLRDDAPTDWEISDKSGAGSHTRNIVALVTPSGRAPWIVVIFISDTDVDFATRNAAIQQLGAEVIELIQN